jgi:glycosyltransferase involved in cell wall biosynthesis
MWQCYNINAEINRSINLAMKMAIRIMNILPIIKNKHKYLFYLCGDRNKASSRVRGYWIAEVLETHSVKCSIEYHHSKAALLYFLFRIVFYDVIFFQKTYSRWHCWLMCWASFLKKTTFLDLDDAPSRVNNPVTLKNVEFMMRRASVVTVGSQALWNYASQFSQNVQLVPSSISLKYYQPATKEQPIEPVCLGWIGNGRHYKEDLIAILKEPLSKISKNQPVRFKLIGSCGEKALYDAFNNIHGLELDFVDQIEWSDPESVSVALSDVDIGLYPLLPNDFNQYKCGFKALEYMAMKIPVISSDIVGNRGIIDNGVTGFFAHSQEDWIEKLECLLTNEKLRTSMGNAGRRKIESKYSTDFTAQKLLAVI